MKKEALVQVICPQEWKPRFLYTHDNVCRHQCGMFFSFARCTHTSPGELHWTGKGDGSISFWGWINMSEPEGRVMTRRRQAAAGRKQQQQAGSSSSKGYICGISYDKRQQQAAAGSSKQRQAGTVVPVVTNLPAPMVFLLPRGWHWVYKLVC